MTEPLPKNLSSHLLQPLIHLLVSLCSINLWGATHSSLDFSRCPSKGSVHRVARPPPQRDESHGGHQASWCQRARVFPRRTWKYLKIPNGLGMFSHPTGFGFYCCTLAISRWYTVADMPCNLTEHLQDYAGKVGWQLQCIESMMCFGFHCSKKPIAAVWAILQSYLCRKGACRDDLHRFNDVMWRCAFLQYPHVICFGSQLQLSRRHVRKVHGIWLSTSIRSGPALDAPHHLDLALPTIAPYMLFDQNPKSWGFNFPKGDPQNGFLLINQYVRSNKGLQPLHVPLPWKPLTPTLSAARVACGAMRRLWRSMPSPRGVEDVARGIRGALAESRTVAGGNCWLQHAFYPRSKWNHSVNIVSILAKLSQAVLVIVWLKGRQVSITWDHSLLILVSWFQVSRSTCPASSKLAVWFFLDASTARGESFSTTSFCSVSQAIYSNHQSR